MMVSLPLQSINTIYCICCACYYSCMVRVVSLLVINNPFLFSFADDDSWTSSDEEDKLPKRKSGSLSVLIPKGMFQIQSYRLYVYNKDLNKY